MAVFGFLMPPETGEKINLSITTMLSMGVYLQSITESIPPTSEAVPLIGQYYVGSLFIVCLATATNVISLVYLNTPLCFNIIFKLRMCIERALHVRVGMSLDGWKNSFLDTWQRSCG